MVSSCKKETQSNEAAPALDSLSAQPQTELSDPDPTDSIPAEAYGINSSNSDTAVIVRGFLQQTYSKDLETNSTMTTVANSFSLNMI